VRYLQDCVAKLQAQREEDPTCTPTQANLPSLSLQAPSDQGRRYTTSNEHDSPDMDMTSSELPSPTVASSRSQEPSISPALLAEDARRRHDSLSSASADRRHYSFGTSAHASPAFGPQSSHYTGSALSAPGSTMTSPALAPMRDVDHEATAALLMLNSDRRGTGGSSTGRGMSVRDLLST